MGGGGGGDSDVTNLNNFLFHSFSRLLRTYMPMRAKRVVHRLSEYLMKGAVWGVPPPPSTQNVFLFLFLLPIACLNFEQTIAGISISIHFRTVVANSNNFQTRPVCSLLSTNEINPSENIFNNNVMQNEISKIVKSWRFNQFLLKSGRLQPHYIDAGGIIYVDILSYNLTQKNCFYRRKFHPPVVRFGGKQDSLIGLRVFKRPQEGGGGVTLTPTNSDKVGGGGG